MKKLRNWILLGFGIVIVIITINSLFFSDEALAAKKHESEQKTTLRIAPIYIERMSVIDQQAMNVVPTTKFTLKGINGNWATFLSTEELKSGTWSCTITLNLQTLDAVMQREYKDEIVQAGIKFNPNQFGGFNLDYKYEDGKTARSTFIPVWNKPEQEGLTIKGLTNGILDAVGNTRVN